MANTIMTRDETQRMRLRNLSVSEGLGVEDVAAWAEERLTTLELELAAIVRQRDALRLLDGMEAIEVSVLGTFLQSPMKDIPETVNAARAVLVRRTLEAERGLVEIRVEVVALREDKARLDAIEKWGGIHVIDWGAGGATGNSWTADPVNYSDKDKPHVAIGRFEGNSLREAIDAAMNSHSEEDNENNDV